MTKGTYEKGWAGKTGLTINISKGCKYNCEYCYAKGIADFFGWKQRDDWQNYELNHAVIEAVSKRKRPYKTKDGHLKQIMFPSSHDIFEEILDPCITVLTKILELGNPVLIVTKPSLNIMDVLCEKLEPYKEQVEFRFTITSSFQDTSLRYEPHAPLPFERKAALIMAYSLDYKTSMSIEPFLDPVKLIADHIKEHEKYVTGTIWLGPMNKGKNGISYCPSDLWDESKWGVAALKRLHELIWDISPKLRYKDSMGEAVLFGEEKAIA